MYPRLLQLCVEIARSADGKCRRCFALTGLRCVFGAQVVVNADGSMCVRASDNKALSDDAKSPPSGE